jgi:DNA mismatch repair protein MutS2
MSFSASNTLQFPELRELVAGFAGSATGRELVTGLEPNSDRDQLESALAEAGEAIGYLAEVHSPQTTGRGAAIRLRFDQVREIASSLQILKVEGARLDGREILDVFVTLELAAEYRGVLLSTGERYPRLARYGARLADLRVFIRRWRNAFLPDGSLADHASPALARIRRDIERQKRSIQDSLNRFLRAHRTDGTLQEDFVTIRDDRYVVPIVAGQKGRVDGVIHGASGTGRTLFVAARG